MRRSLYRQVAELLRSIPASAWPHVELIAERFDTTAEAVISIWSQESQQFIVRNLQRLRAEAEPLARRYCKGEEVLEQAFRLNFPPCLVLRSHLVTLLGLSKQRATEVLKQPALLRAIALPLQPPHGGAGIGSSGGDGGSSREGTSGQVGTTAVPSGSGSRSGGSSAFTATPALLARLEADAARCVEADWLQAPRMDAVRHISGLEGEAVLCTALQAQGVPFWSEESLREQGYFKTPDVRLQVPIATAGGATIDWIDSKATFGDDVQHKSQLREQYAKYVNRFGPGAVVYWAGYVSESGGAAAAAEHLVLLDDVPRNVTQLPRLQI